MRYSYDRQAMDMSLEEAELREMADILKANGYDPRDAKKLQEDRIGPYELEHRIKTTRPGEMGSLEFTHNLKRPGGRLPYPTWKGRSDVFENTGMNTWTMKGQGFVVYLEGGTQGWKARFEWDDEQMLRQSRPWTSGRDCEAVLKAVFSDQVARAKGAQERIDGHLKALNQVL